MGALSDQAVGCDPDGAVAAAVPQFDDPVVPARCQQLSQDRRRVVGGRLPVEVWVDVDSLPGVFGMLAGGRGDRGQQFQDQVFAGIVEPEIGEDAARLADDRRQRLGGGQAGQAGAVVLDQRPATSDQPPAPPRVE